MNEHILTAAALEDFRRSLVRAERSPDTVAKYLRDAGAFYAYLPKDKRVEKETVIAWKQELTRTYKESSANSMLAAVNGLLAFLGWGECRVKQLRVQRQSFRDAARELSKGEYKRLLAAAQRRNNERLCLLMQAICSTGIRVSEHRFLTVEALREGVAMVDNKGKRRAVLLPKELTNALLRYCRRRGIVAGPVFVTRNGTPMNRSNIWAAMKRLSQDAGVDPGKIYPHNLRHLFAVTYYSLEKDIVRLADILGHASVETTRIYTATNILDQRKCLSRLGLVPCRI